MEGKKLLQIDMDGVVCDFAGAITALAPDLDMSNNEERWEERSAQVEQVCRFNPKIFLHLSPIPGAVEAIKELNEHFEIYFLSTPMWSLPESFMHKRMWLETYLKKVAEKRLILTHRKDLVHGDYLVDDTKRHGVDKFKGHHIHFGTLAFPDWEVVTNFLMKDKYNHL